MRRTMRKHPSMNREIFNGGDVASWKALVDITAATVFFLRTGGSFVNIKLTMKLLSPLATQTLQAEAYHLPARII